MKNAVFVLLLILCLSFNFVLAGDLTTAKYAGEFLGLGAGGRSLGMGGAFVALAKDVTAGYWNPAGLAYLEYPQFMLMHSRQFSGELNYDFASAGLPMGKNSSIGLSILRLGIDDIAETALRNPNVGLGELYVDENGQRIRNTPYVESYFSNTDYAFFLTYSKRKSGTFSYGGNVKFINRSIGDNSAWGIGFDIGLIFNPASKWIVGVNLQDITTTLLAWDTGRKELISPSIRAGVTYPIQLSTLGGQLHPAMDFVFRFESRDQAALANLGPGSVDINLGWEYQYHDVFSIRLGFAEFANSDIGQTALGQFSTGIGLNFPKLKVDYAFLGHEDLGNTHRISAKLTLQEPKFKRK